MYSILLSIQYVSIALMLFMCAYITKKWTKPLHGWLFFYCVATLINNAGYLATMLSKTEREAIFSLQLAYLGRVWIPFSLLNFVLLLCKGRRYTKISTPLAFFHAAIYFLMLFVDKTTVYYSSYVFVDSGFFPHIEHTKGIVYKTYTVMILSYIAFALFLLFKKMQSHKNPLKKKQFFFIALSVSVDSIFYVLGKFPVFLSYDMTALGYTVSAFVLGIAIFKFDLLGTKEIAQESMIDRLSDGIIATDNFGEIQYFNKKAKTLYPEIKVGSDSLPAQIFESLQSETHRHITVGNSHFALEQKNLIHEGKEVGKLYALIDETEHIRYMKEKEAQKIQQIQIEAMKSQLKMGNETIFAIANAVEARDKNTGRHSYRVSEYSVLIAGELGFSDEEKEQLRKTGLLHDIGKIGVPDSILNKPAKLTNDEYEIMKTHTEIGGNILKDFTLIPHVEEGAKFHHERYDGKGYPSGLKGEEIPLNARIIGIADAFDAMTANRVYRKALDISFVKEEIKRCAGTQFDPKLAEILLKLIESGKINPAQTVAESASM